MTEWYAMVSPSSGVTLRVNHDDGLCNTCQLPSLAWT
jgi:hypothetical protein